MTGLQRVLLFNVGVALVTTAAFLAIYFATGRSAPANAAFALLALLVLGRRFLRGQPVDERDRLIFARATVVGYAVFWAVFVLGCVSGSLLASSRGAIPAVVLGFMPMAGWVVLELARSIAGLVLYARSS